MEHGLSRACIFGMVYLYIYLTNNNKVMCNSDVKLPELRILSLGFEDVQYPVEKSLRDFKSKVSVFNELMGTPKWYGFDTKHSNECVASRVFTF